MQPHKEYSAVKGLAEGPMVVRTWVGTSGGFHVAHLQRGSGNTAAMLFTFKVTFRNEFAFEFERPLLCHQPFLI